MRIAVANRSTLCPDTDVARWCAAISGQVVECAEHWGRVPVPVQFFGDTRPPEGYDVIVVVDDPDQAGALGWHSATTGSFPFGRVFARPALDNGVAVSSILSHEVLELFVDPFVGLWASDMQSPGRSYALEVCDPVESDGYDIDGVRVSNYCLAAWFDATDQTGPWDRLGTTDGPFRLAPGGYVVYEDEAGAHTVFGESYPEWRKATKESPAARTHKRRAHPGPTAPPAWAWVLISAVRGLRKDMVMLMSDQAHLDADVQALTQATTAVEAEIAALKSQPLAGSLDFSRLDAAVAQLQGDAPAAAPAPAPTPTPEPAPAPAPEPPVTTSQSPIGPPAEPPAPPVSPTV